MRNDFIRLFPAARMGMEMMAPSGMFWIAIPSETAIAALMESPAVPCDAPARTTPTAMPSGRLWIVTARANIAVRESLERGPSGVFAPTCKCGVSSSIAKKEENAKNKSHSRRHDRPRAFVRFRLDCRNE